MMLPEEQEPLLEDKSQEKNNSASRKTLSQAKDELIHKEMFTGHMTEVRKIDPKFINNRIFDAVSFVGNVGIMGFNYGVTAYSAFSNRFLSVPLAVGGQGYNGYLGYNFSNEAREASWKLRWKCSNAVEDFYETTLTYSVGVPLVLTAMAMTGMTLYLTNQLAQVNLGVWSVAVEDTEEGDLKFAHDLLTYPDFPEPINSLWYIGTAISLMALGLLISTTASSELLAFFRKPLDGFLAARHPKFQSKEWQQWFVELYSPLVLRLRQEDQVKQLIDATREYVNQYLSRHVLIEREDRTNDNNPISLPLRSAHDRLNDLLLEQPELKEFSRLADCLSSGDFSEKDLLAAVQNCFDVYRKMERLGRLKDLKEPLIKGSWRAVMYGFILLTLFSWTPFFENLFVKSLAYYILIQCMVVVTYISRWVGESNTLTVMAVQNPDLLKRTGSYIYSYPKETEELGKYIKLFGPGAILSTGTVLHLFLTELGEGITPLWLRYLAAVPFVGASGFFNSSSVGPVARRKIASRDLDNFFHGENTGKIGRHAAVNKLLDVVELVLTLPRAKDVNELLYYLKEDYQARRGFHGEYNESVLVDTFSQKTLTVKEVCETMKMQSPRDARFTGAAAVLKLGLQAAMIGICHKRFSGIALTTLYLGSMFIDWLMGGCARYANACDSQPKQEYRKANNHFFFQAFDAKGTAASLAPTLGCLAADVLFFRLFSHFLAEKDIPEGLHAGPTPEFWLYVSLAVVNFAAGFQEQICGAAVTPSCG